MTRLIKLVIIAGLILVVLWVVLAFIAPQAPSPFGPPLDRSPLGR